MVHLSTIFGNYDYYLEKKEDVEAAFARQMAKAGNNCTAGEMVHRCTECHAVWCVSSASSLGT